MYMGRIVELGSRDEVFSRPSHPYTQALVSAVPVPEPAQREERSRILLAGEVPNPMKPSLGMPVPHPLLEGPGSLRERDPRAGTSPRRKRPDRLPLSRTYRRPGCGRFVIRLRTAHLEVEIHEGRGAEIVRLGRPGGVNRLAWIESDWPLRAGAGGGLPLGRPGVAVRAPGWMAGDVPQTPGPGCAVDGVPHPVHGEVSMAPWEVVDRRGEHEATLRCYNPHRPGGDEEDVAESRPAATPDPRGSPATRSEVPFAYAWGHHPAFAAVPGNESSISTVLASRWTPDSRLPRRISGPVVRGHGRGRRPVTARRWTCAPCPIPPPSGSSTSLS